MSGIPAGAGSLLNKRLGKFEILALLALGGTAEIYLARIGGAAGFEKFVVVKCLHDHLNDDPDFVKMFLDEARLAAHLDHSNVVQTMELGEHDGRYYMVMEFLAGLSMAMVIRRVTERIAGGIMPVSLSLNMLAQACAGLHYAHEKVIAGKHLGIVHRDISPQNLVVSFEGVVKVVDFGIAKAEQRETKTRSGTIKGKFAYMSPEQCVANAVDRRTDIFALGIIAHELLTGRRLFKRSSPYETYQAVIDCNVPKPSSQNVELDPAIDDLVMKALAKDKEQRYPTAEAMGDAILGYLHHRGKGSGPGDVSRYFDQHFDQEIEEHGARMRELIEGRDISLQHGVTWSADEEKKRSKENETVDLGGKHNETQDLDASDLERHSQSSLSAVLSDMGQTGDRSADAPLDDPDDDPDAEGPAEHTRIESNPLEMLAELEQAPALARTKTPPPQAIPSPTRPAPVLKTPAPTLAKPNPIPSVIPSVIPSIVRGQVGPDGRRPQEAKMPVSGPLPLPLPPTPQPGSPVVPSPAAKFPAYSNLPTMIAEPEPDDAPETADAQTMLASSIDVDPPAAAPVAPAKPQGARAFPEQRTLFDPGNSAAPLPGPPPQQQPPQQQPPPPQPQQQQPQQQPPQQPPSPQLPPLYQSQPYQQPPLSQPNMGYGPRDSGDVLNPSLMSPVGPQYPQTDWEAEANTPARALPTWLLIVLFVLALAVALGLTILVARLARG